MPTQINLQPAEDVAPEAPPASMRVRARAVAAPGRTPAVRLPNGWYPSLKMAIRFRPRRAAHGRRAAGHGRVRPGRQTVLAGAGVLHADPRRPRRPAIHDLQAADDDPQLRVAHRPALVRPRRPARDAPRLVPSRVAPRRTAPAAQRPPRRDGAHRPPARTARIRAAAGTCAAGLPPAADGFAGCHRPGPGEAARRHRPRQRRSGRKLAGPTTSTTSSA